MGYNSAPISVLCLGYSKKFSTKWDQLHVTSLPHNQEFTGEGLMILACILCNGMRVVVDEMIYNYTLPVYSCKFLPHISIAGISKDPCFDIPFCGFFRLVLDPGELPFETYYTLID